MSVEPLPEEHCSPLANNCLRQAEYQKLREACIKSYLKKASLTPTFAQNFNLTGLLIQPGVYLKVLAIHLSKIPSPQCHLHPFHDYD